MSAKDAKAFFEIVPGAGGGVAKGAARGRKGKIVELGEAVSSQKDPTVAKTEWAAG